MANDCCSPESRQHPGERGGNSPLFKKLSKKKKIKSAVSHFKILRRHIVRCLVLSSNTLVMQEAICFENKTKKFTPATYRILKG